MLKQSNESTFNNASGIKLGTLRIYEKSTKEYLTFSLVVQLKRQESRLYLFSAQFSKLLSNH